VKFGIVDLHVKLLSSDSFDANPCSASCTSWRWYMILCLYFLYLSCNIDKILYRRSKHNAIEASVSFMTLSSFEVLLYLGV